MRRPGTTMKAPPFLLALLVVSTALGGCLGIEAKSNDPQGPLVPSTPAPEKPAINYTAVKALVGNLTCQAADVNLAQTSSNVKHVKSVNYVTSTQIDAAAITGEIDANANGTVVSQSKGYGSIQRGYENVNATDPIRSKFEGSGFVPRPSGYYSILDPDYYTNLANQYAAPTFDVKYTSDGLNALVGLKDRVAVADTTKPLNPQVPSGGRGYYYFGYPPELTLPANFGEAHRIATLKIGEYHYFFVAPGAAGTSLLAGRVLGTGTYARPELVKVWPTGEGAVDLFATRDAGGQALLYVANGVRGIAVYNVDDPAVPQLLTKIIPPTETPGADLKPAAYSTVGATWLQGRRLLALGAETGSGEIRVFNITQLNRPELVGTWSADGKLGTATLKLQIVNNTLLAAAGPLGIVGFDLTKAQGGAMPVALHYTIPTPPDGRAPTARDLVVRNGLLFIGDDSNGIHMAALGCFPIGDARFQSLG